MERIIQISITGGKGGTGKSFVATNLAILLAEKHDLLLADLDLEAPNDHVLLGINKLHNKEDIKIFLPFIDYKKCTLCGICAKICDTGAIFMPPKSPPIVFPRLCSGCKACYYACPYDAIIEGGHVIAHSYLTNVTKFNVSFRLLTGILEPGEEHIPPGLAIIKRKARELAKEILLIDTGAGAGSSISIALQYSDLVIAVTEPTPLGLHDLESILKIANGLGYRTWVIINRYGLGPIDDHLKIMKIYGVEKYFKIPYSIDAVKSYIQGIPIVVYNPDSIVSKSFYDIYQVLEDEIL